MNSEEWRDAVNKSADHFIQAKGGFDTLVTSTKGVSAWALFDKEFTEELLETGLANEADLDF